MLSIFHIFAHGGEVHSSPVISRIHSFAWYFQVPLFLCLIGAVFSLAWLLTKKVSSALLTSSFVLLVVGFGSYQVAPIVSILAITVGLGTTLFLTLVGLETKEK